MAERRPSDPPSRNGGRRVVPPRRLPLAGTRPSTEILSGRTWATGDRDAVGRDPSPAAGQGRERLAVQCTVTLGRIPQTPAGRRVSADHSERGGRSCVTATAYTAPHPHATCDSPVSTVRDSPHWHVSRSVGGVSESNGPTPHYKRETGTCRFTVVSVRERTSPHLWSWGMKTDDSIRRSPGPTLRPSDSAAAASTSRDAEFDVEVRG